MCIRDSSYTHQFGTSAIKLAGAGNQTVSGTGKIYSLEAANGGNVLIPSNLTLLPGGILTGSSLITGGVLNIGDGLTAGNYSVTFSGSVDAVDIKLDNSWSLALGADLTINNSLTLTSLAQVTGNFDLVALGSVTSNDTSYTHQFGTSAIKLALSLIHI